MSAERLLEHVRHLRRPPRRRASRRSCPTPGGRRDHRTRDRLARPARSGQDLVGRQGADPLRHRWRRAGGDRDRPCRGVPRSSRRRAARSGENCCTTWVSSTSTTRAAPSSPTRSAGTPTATASTSCSTRCRVRRRRAGLDLLSFGGRFVEIGKRDIYGDTRLGLFPFRRNLSFYAVDLGVDDASPIPRPGPRAAEHGVRAHRGRLAADAGEHALPDSAMRPPPSVWSAAPGTPARWCSTFRGRGAAWPWCRRRRLGCSGPTAPTSSPAAWAASGSSSPVRWRRRAADGSCSTPGRRPARRRRRRSSGSAPPAPTSRSSAATSPNPERRSAWWRSATEPGFRCAAYCTPRRWSRTPR